MSRYLIGSALLITVILGGSWLYLVFQGPRMRVQQHVRAFQAVTPVLPPGSLPRGAKRSLQEQARQDTLQNPLEDTSKIRGAGKVYYSYYCAFCHGETGDGSAPVGDSYMPAPSPLRQDQLKNMKDSELLLAMLTGTGHEPVLERVVPSGHRWPLVLYVRRLAAKGKNVSSR